MENEGKTLTSPSWGIFCGVFGWVFILAGLGLFVWGFCLFGWFGLLYFVVWFGLILDFGFFGGAGGWVF